jgi:TolB protein
MTVSRWVAMSIALVAGVAAGAATPQPVGQFVDHRDLGGPAHPGTTSYDAKTGTYSITGGGSNMWAGHDAFQFAWKPMSGNVAMQTDLDFTSPKPSPTAGGFLHRKGGVVLRQDLDPDSAYVDAIRMSNDQLSLQYREVKGGQTRLIWINTSRLGTVKLEKIGDYAYLSVPGPDGKLHRAGGSFKLKITGTYYIGLGVCAHDDTTSETMAFSKVKITPLPASATGRSNDTALQTIQVANEFEQTVLHRGTGPIEIAGWSPDGKDIVYRTGGAAWSATGWDSDRVEKLAGATPALAAVPAGDWVYSGAPAGSGSGLWRARADGSARTRIDTGAGSAFDPRLSPDGKWLVYLATEMPTRTLAAATDVALRRMPVADGVPQPDKAITLSKFRGGAGSLARAAWSPDSRLIAFVTRD